MRVSRKYHKVPVNRTIDEIRITVYRRMDIRVQHTTERDTGRETVAIIVRRDGKLREYAVHDLTEEYEERE